MYQDTTPQNSTLSRRLFVSVVILLLATLLRFWTLGRNSFWLDEAQLFTLGAKSLSAIWFTEPDIGHPPLYYAFIHFWLYFGRSELLIRLPSALFSLIGVALTGCLGRRLGGEKAGIWASLLLAVAPLDIWYAQEARMYAAVLVTTLLLALVLQDRMLSHSPARTGAQAKAISWVWFGLVLALGLYIDFPMMVVWSGLSGLWLGWWWHSGREAHLFRLWLWGSLLGWGLFIPGFWYVLKFTQALNYMISLPATIATPFWLVLVSILPLAVAAGAAIFLWPYLARKKFWLWGMVAGLLLVVGTDLFMVWPHYYLPKRLAMVLWPYLILGLIGLLVYYRYRRLIMAVVLFSLVTTLIMLATVAKDDWRGVVAYMNDAAAPGEQIWLASAADVLPYNYYQPRYPGKNAPWAEFQDAAATPTRFWLITGPVSNPAFQAWLTENRRLVNHISFYRIDIWEYAENMD